MLTTKAVTLSRAYGELCLLAGQTMASEHRHYSIETGVSDEGDQYTLFFVRENDDFPEIVVSEDGSNDPIFTRGNPS